MTIQLKFGQHSEGLRAKLTTSLICWRLHVTNVHLKGILDAKWKGRFPELTFQQRSGLYLNLKCSFPVMPQVMFQRRDGIEMKWKSSFPTQTNFKVWKLRAMKFHQTARMALWKKIPSLPSGPEHHPAWTLLYAYWENSLCQQTWEGRMSLVCVGKTNWTQQEFRKLKTWYMNSIQLLPQKESMFGGSVGKQLTLIWGRHSVRDSTMRAIYTWMLSINFLRYCVWMSFFN